MQNIRFAEMSVGDSVKLDELQWCSEHREIHQAACDYMASVADDVKPQFEIRGNDVNKDDRGNLIGYTLVRIR